MEFLPAVAHGPEDAQKLLAAGEADRIDGYLVYQMNNWVQVMQTDRRLRASRRWWPISPYAGSGGFLVFTAGLRRTHKNFSVVASSKIEDLAESARCFAIAQERRHDRRVRRRLRPRAARADRPATAPRPARTTR